MTDTTHLLARYRQHTLNAAADRAVQRALAESIDVVIEPSSPAGKQALRGIPCIANGVSGTAPGTDPATALFKATCDCGRAKEPTRRQCIECHRATQPEANLNTANPAATIRHATARRIT